MASRVDDVHHFIVSRQSEWIGEIDDEIQDVQWKPSNGKDKGNGHQQAVPSAQPLLHIMLCNKTHNLISFNINFF